MRTRCALVVVLAFAVGGCGSSGHSIPTAASTQQQATALVSQQAVDLLEELSRTAEDLATGNRTEYDAARDGLPYHHYQAESVVMHAQERLAAGNPARPVFIQIAETLASTVTELNRVGRNAPARASLLDVSDTLSTLAVEADHVTDSIPATLRTQIHTDLSSVAAQARAAAAGA